MIRAPKYAMRRRNPPHCGSAGWVFPRCRAGCASLVVQAVVFLQITRVIGPKLAQRHIRKRRRALALAHQHQIPGQNKTVFKAPAYPLGASAALRFCRFPCFWRAKTQLYCKIPIVRRKIRADERMVGLKAQALFFLRQCETDAWSSRPPRFRAGWFLPCRSRRRPGLTDGSKAKPRLFIIAEIFQRKRVNVQSAHRMDGFFLFSRRAARRLPSEWRKAGNNRRCLWS